MRPDIPATVQWLESIALECTHELHLSRSQSALLRTLLEKAVRDFPLEALCTEFKTILTTQPPVVLEGTMSATGCKLWRKALRLQQRRSNLEERLEVGKAWFEVESQTTFNQPVRLIRQRGHPRDMLVTSVEIGRDQYYPKGRAILTGTVFRPPRTYTLIQDYLPGDRLIRLNWSDMPPSAQSHKKPSGK